MPPCPRRCGVIIRHLPQKNFHVGYTAAMKREFPFKAKLGNRVVTVWAENHPGLYSVEGFGLVSKSSLVPVEEYSEDYFLPQQLAVVESQDAGPKRWKRRGFFSEPYKPVPRRTRQERNRETRRWLKEAMRNAPVEASAILYSARRYGISLRSLYKAKKFYHVVSYKRGGYRGREGARWFWAYSLPD